MAGTGAGPSRRSHTKSRKGCKTCKRRHIRCDETFPQCRNCTKHQVRCDYMDNVGSDAESQASPDQASVHVALTPRSESRVEQWQTTGSFPYPQLNVFPPPQTHEYTRDELRLMHHISSVTNDLISRGTSDLTLWTSQMPKFLSIAANHPFVMQALLSFSANHLAWVQTSSDMRNMYLQHGSIALGGLHEAIGSFSPANADAVLAASLLLLWQATDYRSWSSLRAGIQSVISASQSWQLESVFHEYIAEQEVLSAAYRTHRRRSSVTTTDREAILQNAIFALQRLQLSLVGQHLELGWINQLLNYVRHLQSLGAVSSPEEQFNCLYQLRKWLFWVPTALLEQQGGQGPALLTAAHLYSVAIALEPLFPDLGCSFISALALGPLESIIAVTDAMQHHQGISGTALEIASFMEYPRATALNYRARAAQIQPDHTPMIQLTPDTLNYTSIGNLSPAFAPSALHYGNTTPATQTTYLEVPLQNASSFTYGLEEWGTVPSPALFATPFSDAEEQMYGYNNNNNINSGMSLGGFRGGLVTPTEIWT